jgi:Cupin superfamily protein
MLHEGEYETLSSAVKKAWDLLSDPEFTEATVLQQAAGRGADVLCHEFLRAINTQNTPAWQVRVVLDGVRVPPYHYSVSKQLKILHPDVIDREALNRHFQRGATIMLDDAQTAISTVDQLCLDLTEHSSFPVAGTIFASPPHAEGFALHQDAEDVVIVQLAGAKSWTVFPPLARRNSSMLKRAECDDPIIESRLCSGDVLVLPKGSPHKTASNSAAGSVHITLGFYPITLRDVLMKIIDHIPDPRLDDPVPGDAREVVEIASSWLNTAATFDAGSIGEMVSGSIPPLVEGLRSRLRGDTTHFRLPPSGPPSYAEGGNYRLLTSISGSMRLFLAAQLSRSTEEIRAITTTLEDKDRGDTFTYREFAANASDGVLAQELLHEMLRMRFVAHVWLEEGEE